MQCELTRNTTSGRPWNWHPGTAIVGSTEVCPRIGIDVVGEFRETDSRSQAIDQLARPIGTLSIRLTWLARPNAV
jgi:hypothetical protein